MDKILELKERVKGNKRRIVLPESMDERVLKAACILIEEDLVDIILIGKKENVIDKYPILGRANWYNPEDIVFEYTNKLYELRKDKGLTIEEAKNLILNDYMYLACLLVLEGKADGIVSGACHSSSNTLRPALQLIKGPDGFVSSFFLMETDKTDLGSNGLFIFADCGLNQEPSPDELALIAKHSIDSFKLIVCFLLSSLLKFSTAFFSNLILFMANFTCLNFWDNIEEKSFILSSDKSSIKAGI